ncbi:MAG TPA: alpha/beta hydrolase [Acidimicrobiia bacterium]|nr:alpha/beta hydrolase [Acidimicrobiia bacterium]
MKDARERSVWLDGLRIHVREVGQGPPVLLLNGVAADTGMWARLEAAFDGFHLISFDAPGAGRSPAPLVPVPIARLARLATLVLDTVGVQQADVIGYSMGGIVAQQLAADAPERVRRVVLAGTTCGLGAIPGDPLAMLHLLVPARYLSPRIYARTIGGIVGGPARHDRAVVADLLAVRLRRVSIRGYLGQMLSLSRWTGLPLLARIPHPTLVVSGDDDPLSPPANAMLLTRLLPQARMVVAPGEGHLLFMSAQSPVLRPIREFLAAESLDDAAVWREAAGVTDKELRAAIPSLRSQAQPWGVIGVVFRRRWLSRAVPVGVDPRDPSALQRRPQ